MELTPEQIDRITRRARIDARALACGYPAPPVPFTGDELALYQIKYAEAMEAYRK
jgi:hypothetical protein